MHTGYTKLFVCSMLLLLCSQLTKADDTTTPAKSEEADSSSEETVEDSNETERRKRSADSLNEPSLDTATAGSQRIGIPGLPDPATIIKIAEIVQAVGEKVIPILVEGNTAGSAVADRLLSDYKFLRNFQRELNKFTDELKQRKK